MTEHHIVHPIDISKIDRGGHSIFAPSSSAMWANCSGSLVPNLLAKDTGRYEAAEGSVAHGVAEEWLRKGERPTHLLGTIESIENPDGDPFDVLIDEVMLGHVEEYVNWCMYLPGDHHVEVRVDFSDLTPLKKQTGTSDHMACEMGRLTVTDLKYGTGIKVFAENNTQAILYAYGAFKEWDWFYDFQEIVIRIAQPRLDHFDVWTITREQLLEWAAWLKERAFAAWCKDAARTPGEKQCQWCRISNDCAAHLVFVSKLTDGVFDDLDSEVTKDEMLETMRKLDDDTLNLRPISVGELTLAQKSKLLNYSGMIVSWFKSIEEALQQAALDGAEIPGRKLVEGRSFRVFNKNPIDHLSFLGLNEDECYKPRELISPAEAERLLMKAGYKKKQLPELLAEVVEKPRGKPTLVVESDPRPTFVSSENVFDDLDDEL